MHHLDAPAAPHADLRTSAATRAAGHTYVCFSHIYIYIYTYIYIYSFYSQDLSGDEGGGGGAVKRSATGESSSLSRERGISQNSYVP